MNHSKAWTLYGMQIRKRISGREETDEGGRGGGRGVAMGASSSLLAGIFLADELERMVVFEATEGALVNCSFAMPSAVVSPSRGIKVDADDLVGGDEDEDSRDETRDDRRPIQELPFVAVFDVMSQPCA